MLVWCVCGCWSGMFFLDMKWTFVWPRSPYMLSLSRGFTLTNPTFPLPH